MTKPKGLRLSPTLTLPYEFATEGVAVIGMRGSGKSNTEARFAELLHAAGIPFVVVDPKGDWDGIRSSADGKHEGLPIPVFGGLHGDFPLEPEHGARIADLLVDENMSAILDVSALSKTGGLPRFLLGFCKQLKHRHQLDPHVRTVILEEAHRYIPQMLPKSDVQAAEMKEAAASILLEGRAFGLGCWAATQRPARLHKDVLEEVGTAIVHRIGVAAKNDKSAIKAWVQHYDVSEEILDSLTSLKAGEAWVLIPDLGIVQRVQMDRRTTFDSAATPKVGARIRRPTTMADIDQGAIKEALADAIEKAKEADPRELRKRLKDAERALEAERTRGDHHERQLAELEAQVAEPVEVPVPFVPEWIGPALRTSLESVDTTLEIATNLRAVVAELVDRVGAAATGLVAVERAVARPPARAPRAAPTSAPRPVRPTPPRAAPDSSTGSLGKRERAIVAALANYPLGRSQKQLSLLCGYSTRTSTIGVGLSELRNLGLVERGGMPRLTEAGFAYARDAGIEPLPEGPDLLEYWREQLGADSRERRALEALLADPDRVWTNAELSEACGYSARTSTLGVGLSKLRGLGIMAKGQPPRLSLEFTEAIE